MTVEVDDTIERYTVGGTGPYAFSFRIFAETDLAVCACSAAAPPVPTPLTYLTHYTVTGANDQSGGEVTLTTDAAAAFAGFTLDIRSNTPQTQPTSIRNLGRFLPEIHEDAFDRLSRQVQDLGRRSHSAIHLPDNENLSCEVEPAEVRKGKYLFWDTVTGAISSAISVTGTVFTQLIFNAYYALTDTHKKTPAEAAAGVTVVNGMYLPGHAYRYGTNLIPGTTNMTAALNASLLQAYETGGADPYWPADTYLVSNLTLSGGYIHIRTDGYATTLKQVPGFIELAILYMAGVENIHLEALSVIGNMTDSGEWNHAVGLGSACSHIRIDGVRGTNIRGDVLNIAGTEGAGGVYDVQVGQVIGTNVYREVVSITGGEGIEIDSVQGTQVGYRLLDVEPNEGSQSPAGIRIKYVRGSNIQVAGGNLADTVGVGSVVIDYLDMDNSLHADSSPGYPTHPPIDGNIALILGDCQSLRIGTFKARGYADRVVSDTASTVQCHLVIDYFDCDDSNTTEVTYKTLIEGLTLSRLDINGGVVVLQGSDRYICKDVQCTLKNLRVYNGCIAASADNCEFDGITYDGTGVTDAIFNDIDQSILKNFVAVNASGASLMSACQDNILVSCYGTFGAVNAGGGVNLYQKCVLNSTTYELRSDLQGSKTYDIPSLGTGAIDQTTVTVSGAVKGDFALVSMNVDLAGVKQLVTIDATNTASVLSWNPTGGTLNPVSGTMTVRVWKA